MKNLGPMGKLVEMIPGFNAKELKGVDFSQSEKNMGSMEAIIHSMTTKERKNPSIVSSSPSRKKRIADGSGSTIQAVNKLLKDFEMMKKMMKQMKGMGGKAGKFGKKGLFGKLPF